MTGNRVTAQVIEISEINVDPYNDSSFQTTPLEINQIKNTQKANQTPNTLYIKATPTPKPLPEVSGNLKTSKQTLPAIPALSPPYSQQQNNSPTIDTTNSSISVSPFDITPNNDKDTLSPTKKDNQSTSTNQVRSISVSPNNTSSINNQPKKSSPSQNSTTRRSLKDILVQSNDNNSIPTKPVTNQTNKSNVSVTTANNQAIYKVLVKVKNMEEKSQIKTLYPEAFTKKINGDSFLQIGIFSARENAEQVSQSLSTIGFKALIIK